VTPPTAVEVRDAFGIEIGDLRRQGEGWESVGWTDGTWFVKVWRAAPPANLHVLEQLDLPVPVPRRTLDGALSAPTSVGTIGVFPLVPGRHATADDWPLVARSLRRLHDHPLVDLPVAEIDEPCIAELRAHLDHPWIRDRRDEVTAHVDRLEAVIDRARSTEVPHVVCHRDFGGWNLLIDRGEVTGILDWDWACIGPREHDLWIAFEEVEQDPVAFLREYGAARLDLTHLEYAWLARAVRDLTARVVAESDREGVDTWGFDRWRRLDADLARARPFCSD
jgi:Ser/Thr protein kinase RdoA (MazF antagonist)